MVSSGLLRRVALVRTNVSEERSVSFIRVTRIDELGTTTTTILQSHRRESTKSYISFTLHETNINKPSLLSQQLNWFMVFQQH
jgi:hypothetical protein